MIKSNPKTKKILLPPMVLVTLTLIFGFTSNYLVHKDFKLMIKYQPAPEEELMDFEEIDISFLLDILANNRVILIDARTEDLFVESHIPGALNLPVYEFNDRLPLMKDKIPLDQTIITYCIDEDCPDSLLLANRLYQAGFKNLFIFKAGMKGWNEFHQLNHNR